MRASRELDIVVFGATGVTGAFVVEELQRDSEDLRWGVAGRNADRLRQTLRMAATNLGLEENALDGVPVIVADAADESSLLAMAQRTRLVLNTVGPYSFYGRQVVQACVDSGTHHIDISAEPQFMKEIEADFDDVAREKGVLVLRACGFASIPAEMCLSFLRQHFQGDLDQVESFLNINEGPQGLKINFGTMQSIMHWLRHSTEVAAVLRDVRDVLFSGPRAPCYWRLPERCILFRSEVAGGWCLPYPCCDRYVMHRGDMLRQHLFDIKPVQVRTYMRAPGFFTGLGLVLLGTIFGLLSLFSAGRWLLERFPEFFSAGKVKRGAPTREQVLSCSFTMTMHGSGWKENHALPGEREVGRTNHSVTIRLDGPDPAYVTTAMCMVQVAMVVLKELDKMAIKGGVLSPGVVLDGTSYMDRIQKRGIRMAIV
ncbi:saccharopine dehydrogenase-like oxidoreductase [Amblyomma americanum]